MSIVVLNYNYAQFLPASVGSALGQVSADVEVIVVDDGSSDDSVAVINTFSGIRRVLKDNGGQASAMNAGYAEATGDVVIFLDADDVLFPTAARDVAAEVAAHPDVAWVMYRLRLLDAEGHESQNVRPRRAGVMPQGDLRKHIGRYRCFHWQPTSGNAFSRAALDHVMPIPEADYRISADAYLASVIPLVGTIRSLDAVLGGYRVHGKSNFTSGVVDATYFQDQVRRQVVNHEHARQVAERVGVTIPRDVRAPRDAAFIGFRLGAVLHSSTTPAMEGDHRVSLATSGIRAALTNPLLPWPNRLRRAAWFLVAAAPGQRARQWAIAHAPDTPARRAQLAAQPRTD